MSTRQELSEAVRGLRDAVAVAERAHDDERGSIEPRGAESVDDGGEVAKIDEAGVEDVAGGEKEIGEGEEIEEEEGEAEARDAGGGRRGGRGVSIRVGARASGPAAGTRREADAVCNAVDEMRMTLPPVSQQTTA